MSYELGAIRVPTARHPQCAKYRSFLSRTMCDMNMDKCGKVRCQGGALSQIGKALIIPAAVVTFAVGGPALARVLSSAAAKAAAKRAAFIGPPAPGGSSLLSRGARGLFNLGRNLLSKPATPTGTPPIIDFPSATSPGFSQPSIPEGPSVQSDAATMQTGGGGGGMSPTTPFMDESAPEAAGAGAPKPGMSPLLIIGGLLLVGSMFKKSSRRR